MIYNSLDENLFSPCSGSIHNRNKKKIKQSDYDNAVTEWQNNPEASD